MCDQGISLCLPAMPSFLMWLLGINFSNHTAASVAAFISHGPGLCFIMSVSWPAHSSLLGFAIPQIAEVTASSSCQSLATKHRLPYPPLRPCPCCPCSQLVRWNPMFHQQPSVSHSLPILAFHTALGFLTLQSLTTLVYAVSSQP